MFEVEISFELYLLRLGFFFFFVGGGGGGVLAVLLTHSFFKGSIWHISGSFVLSAYIIWILESDK